MSSFLDSTGLSRLVSKITDYFAKKDGTYPDMTVGNATIATHLSAYGEWDTWPSGYRPANPYALICEIKTLTDANNGFNELLQFEKSDLYLFKLRLGIFFSKTNGFEHPDVFILESNISKSDITSAVKITYGKETRDAIEFAVVRIYVRFTGNYQTWRVRQLDAQTGDSGHLNWRGVTFFKGSSTSIATPIGTDATFISSVPYASGQVGSASQPVYVDSNGQVQVCSSMMQGVESIYYTNLTSTWSRIATVTITSNDLIAFSADISEADTGYLSLHIEFRLRKISNVMRLSATVTNMSFDSNANNTVSVGYTANGNDYTIYLKVGATQYTGLTGRIRLRYAQEIGWQRALFTPSVANMTGSENLTAGIVRTVSVS